MTTNEKPLRFGLAGLGPGMLTLLDGFRRSPYAQVTAAADVRVEAVQAFGRDWDVETFTSVAELCTSPNIDAVCIATPTHLHAEHVLEAARNGKHIFVSKPMALTLDDCEKMNDTADQYGVKLLAGHTQSMYPEIRKMAELVRSGEFGKLGMLHTWHYTEWIYRPRMPYELDVNQGGGVVFRQSPHQIDMLRLIAGGVVKSVRATVMQLDPTRPTPGAYVVYLQFADGVPGTIIYSGYGHFNATELTSGRVEVPRRLAETASTPEEEQALKESWRYSASNQRSAHPESEGREERDPAFGLTLVTCALADIRQSPAGLLIYDGKGRHELPVDQSEARGEPEIEELYNGAVHGRPLIHDGHWGTATHEVTLAINQSSQEGREIFLSRQVAYPA